MCKKAAGTVIEADDRLLLGVCSGGSADTVRANRGRVLLYVVETMCFNLIVSCERFDFLINVYVSKDFCFFFYYYVVTFERTEIRFFQKQVILTTRRE